MKIVYLLMVGLLMVGCKVKYIDADSTDGIASVDTIDIQDFEKAAKDMLATLINSDAIASVDGKKRVVMISRVLNNTEHHIDTDLLIKTIRVKLNQSGRVLITTAVGHSGAEDPSNKGVRNLRADDEFNQAGVQKKGTLVAPDLSLGGKIIQLKSSAGSTKQSAFAFQLSLTDLKTGLAMWEGNVNIVKQGKKSSVGW